MRWPRPLLVALGTGSLAAAGCVPDLDFDFNTNATTIIATGGPNGGTEVDICPGPQGLLACSAGSFDVAYGSAEEPAMTGLLSFGTLEADFDSTEAGTITVTRADGATATATADPFELIGPSPTAVVKHDAMIYLVWTPSGGATASWIGNVLCGQTDTPMQQAIDVPDSGTLAISTSLLPYDGAAACTATIGLTRVHDGEVGLGFAADSTFEVDQERTVSFQISE